ncbi:MAG: glycosyltransferase family 4 protein, partial [Candidatus Helarchaeota archaeon]|nr:glycosyltransferase family 4 protein [Candidatus Helarchaeota archaeon]
SPEKPESLLMAKRQIDSLAALGLKVKVCLFEGSGLRKYWQGYRQLKQKLGNESFDLVHAHYAYVGWVARLQIQCPLIVSFMGSDVVGNFRNKGVWRFISAAMHRMAAYLLSTLCDASIVKSRRLARWTIPNKTFVIPNGVDLEVFMPLDHDQCRRSLGLKQNGKYIVFSSSEDLRKPVKRLGLALSAVEKVKTSFPEVEMTVLSGLSTNHVVQYLNAADVLLLTSYAEGSPNIIKEALACNLPIVSVDVGDVAERILGVQNCYISLPTPEALAQKLCMVLQTGGRSNGREKIGELALPRIAEQVVGVYLNSLARR